MNRPGKPETDQMSVIERDTTLSERSEGVPYWRGDLRANPGDSDGPRGFRIDPSVARYGSMSARARQLYTLEEMLSKDHVTAGLLAIFLGVFGIHKFYMGSNQAGFLMLAVSIIGCFLTFGIAPLVIGMIALIEGIIYLSKPQAEFEYIYVANQRYWF